MGCDIHLVLEQRDTETGIWVGINDFGYIDPKCVSVSGIGSGKHAGVWWLARERNYELFAALAGVRGDGPSPKGLPEDVSTLAKMRVREWGDDGHSHTWWPLKDAARMWAEANNYDYKAEQVTAKLTSARSAVAPPEQKFFGLDEEDDLEDFRVVCWFDN